MAVIDSDAHVLETEHTWDYMLESERGMRPQIVATPDDPSSGGESWLVDGTYIGKARNVGHDTAREAREMQDIKARLLHMDALDVDVQVLYPTIFLRPFTRRPEVELALARIEELFRRTVRIQDKLKTSTHYSLAQLRLVEAVVLAVVNDDFVLGPTVRRWLDAFDRHGAGLREELS